MPPTYHSTDDDIHPGFNLSVVRKLYGYMQSYRSEFLRLLLIMIVYAGLDAGLPLLTRAAIDRFAVTRSGAGLGWFALICLLFAFGRGITVRAMIITSGTVYTGMGYDIRRDGFNHLQKLSFSFFDQHAVGWLMARLSSDAQHLSRTFAWGIGDLVDGVGKLLIMTAIMFWLSPFLALVVLAVVPVLALVIGWYQATSMRKFRAVRRASSEVTGAFNEGVTGAVTTKTLVREAASLREFSGRTDELRRVSVEAARRSAFYFPIVLVLGTVASALAIWLGGNGVLAGTVSYGTLVAFTAYAVSFFVPLHDIARRFPQLQNAQAAAERIFSMLDTEPEIRDRESDPVGAAAPELRELSGAIRFDRVSFAYKPGEPVVQDFSLAVEPGETVALVGQTGVGKTTLVSLLCRFRDPTSGKILVDGHDARDLPLAWYRRHLGIVLQRAYLFSGSIRENIRYGRLESTDAEVEKAARTVDAHDFIMACTAGYDFDVGEGGGNLSAGQKQLIALARVVLADPRILVLDEATSAVDTETEQHLQSAIDRVLNQRTSFVIAHRLSTIRKADRIILLGPDGIVEQGPHRALIQQRGAYYQLYANQFIAEHEAQVMRNA